MNKEFNREVELPGTYQSPRVSSEVMDCSLPMTFDHLSICGGHKCLYCFSFYSKSNNAMLAEGSSRRVPINLRSADMPKMMLTMQGKEITDKRSQSLYDNFYKKKFILHWGGLADPFCHFESYNNVGLPFLQFLGETNYPTLFSFKGSAILKKEYIQLFEKYSSQKNFAFQISMVTFDNEKARNVEINVPSPTVRLKIMKMLSQMGYYCILRLRPFILGITDETLDELLDAALEAGMKGVSTEFFALDARANAGMMERYKWLAEQTGIDNLTKYFSKLSPLERGTYRRLNWKVKEYWVKKIFLFCQKHNLVFGCSDPDFKELNSSGSCFRGETRVLIRTKHSPYVRSVELRELHDTFKDPIIVLCKGKWKEAKAIRINYKRSWYKIVLKSGCQMIVTDDHVHYVHSVEGVDTKLTKNLGVGDFILMNNKPMPTVSNRGTYDVGRFVGLYLANGSGAFTNNGGKFGLCFNKNKTETISFVQKFIENLGGYIPVSTPIKGWLPFNCVSKTITGLVGSFINGKRARYKNLREICFGMSEDFRKGLLFGWLEGDAGSSVSQKLVEDMQSIAVTLGIPAKIGVYLRKNENFYFNKHGKKKPGPKSKIFTFCISITEIKNSILKDKISYKTNKIYRRNYHEIDKEIYSQIIDIQEIWFKEPYAYCLTVKDGHQFQVLNGIITHNCCALPDNFPANKGLENWSKDQLTYHLKEARKLYHSTGKQKVLSFDGVYGKNATFLDDVEFHDDHVSVIGKSQPIRNATTVRHVISRHWNSLGSPANPRNYFDRILEPCGKDSKGYMLYKYNPRPYEAEWVKEGIDLTI